MDPLKDTKDNTNTFKGHDNRDFLVNYDKFSVQNDIERLNKLFKKTHKIMTALYLITDIIDQEEPIRVHLRRHALTLHTSVWQTLRNGQKAHLLIAESEHVAGEIASLLAVGASGRLVSPMNYRLLEASIASFREECGVYGESAYRTLFVPPESDYIPHVGKRNNLESFESIGQPIKDTTFSKGHAETIKDTTNIKTTLNKRMDIGIKINRRNSILKVIKDKKTVTIKDIKSVLKDISIKTIQREINALVSEGVLQKTGDKRWAKYAVRIHLSQ